MTDRVYCYSCKIHHPRDEMQRLHTSRGLRWRCKRSLMAAQTSIQERDDFGRRQTEINREKARKLVEQSLVLPQDRRFQW